MPRTLCFAKRSVRGPAPQTVQDVRSLRIVCLLDMRSLSRSRIRHGTRMVQQLHLTLTKNVTRREQTKSASQNLAYPALRRQAASSKARRRRRTLCGTSRRSNAGDGRLPPQPMVCRWAGPICVAALRGSSLAYRNRVRRAPRALRGSHLGPAQGTGDAGTHSKPLRMFARRAP